MVLIEAKEKEKEKVMDDEEDEYEDEEGVRRGTYLRLKDLRSDYEEEHWDVGICFWLYLVKSIAFPVTILQKTVENKPEAVESFPFLVINEKNVMTFPFLMLHKEAPDSADPDSYPRLSIDFEFPLEKWVHIGYEASHEFMRLQIDDVTGESPLSSDEEKECPWIISLVSGCRDNNDDNQGYIYDFNSVWYPGSLFTEKHRAEDLPVQLFLDKSSVVEIEEGDGGIWSIVGGKASCRRNFSLDVVLVDANGQPVTTEMEVVASLIYVDNGTPVERTSDGEAPLLASYDGVEFDSYDRPSKLLNGRASFRLKISQLSSKCQCRLFRILFCVPKMKKYPFFEAFSPPIRSISRNRNARVSPTTWKRPTSSLHQISQTPGFDEDTMEVQQSSLHETESDPSSKRLRLGKDKIFSNFKSDHPMLNRPDEECNSHTSTGNKVEDAIATSLSLGAENSVEENSTTDSESTEVRNSAPKSTSTVGSPISDISVFKYCLAGITERSLLLKEIANSASDEEILDFAHQVSLYSGCSHHSNQILMAKRLVEEGTKSWKSISQNNNWVLWEYMVFEIEQQFTKISHCSSRSLSEQDLDILRRIGGCKEYVSQENFEKMWCWLYPVADTLSRSSNINAMWSCTTPKWIEGFITKEEAETSLQGPHGVQVSGTFLLRFPTSRSWPHPDAGCLVVTYVASDYTLRHKLLSLDRMYSLTGKENDAKPLQEMLLEDPELSRLGRVIRSN